MYGDRTESADIEDPVNVHTGNFYDTRTDLELPTAAEPIRWSRTYNSRDTAGGLLGKGWWTTFDTHIRVLPNGDAILVAEDGQRIRFSPDGTGGFTTDQTFPATLSSTASGYTLGWPDQSTSQFDTTGRLTSRSDWSGNVATFTRDANGRLDTITTNRGYSVALSYTGPILSGLAFSDGRSISFSRDTSYRLTGVTLPDGGVETFTIDAAGLIGEITDPEGRLVVRNTYDGLGRVLTQDTPYGDVVQFTYDDVNDTTTVTNTVTGGSTVFVHDGDYRLTSVLDAQGAAVTRTYDAEGNIASVTDRRNGTLTWEWDAAGNPVKETLPSGAERTWQWDAMNRPVSVSDGLGEQTTFTYVGDDAAH